MLIQDLSRQRGQLQALVRYAAGNGGLRMDGLTDDEQDALFALAEAGDNDDLLRQKKQVVALTKLVQKSVRLPVYTTEQAAAWLGVSVRTLYTAKAEGRIGANKPAHDLLFPHEELEKYQKSRRYPLA